MNLLSSMLNNRGNSHGRARDQIETFWPAANSWKKNVEIYFSLLIPYQNNTINSFVLDVDILRMKLLHFMAGKTLQ
jgi:hypothetical protein